MKGSLFSKEKLLLLFDRNKRFHDAWLLLLLLLLLLLFALRQKQAQQVIHLQKQDGNQAVKQARQQLNDKHHDEIAIDANV